MSNEIKVEKWNGYDIRFVTHEGDWWAVLADICKPLGLRAKKLSERLDDEDLSKGLVSDSIGRQQEMLIVNRFGIYDTIFASRKPEVKPFKRWVYSVIDYLREQSGLEGYEIFKLDDVEFQKNCMKRLHDNLPTPTPLDYIKANKIVNKAVSNVYGFEKSISKDDMTVPMLKFRQEILNYTIDFIIARYRFGLDISISENVYNKAHELFNNMEE